MRKINIFLFLTISFLLITKSYADVTYTIRNAEDTFTPARLSTDIQITNKTKQSLYFIGCSCTQMRYKDCESQGILPNTSIALRLTTTPNKKADNDGNVVGQCSLTFVPQDNSDIYYMGVSYDEYHNRDNNGFIYISNWEIYSWSKYGHIYNTDESFKPYWKSSKIESYFVTLRKY